MVGRDVDAYIQKGGSRGSRNPQTILNFPQKDCLRTRKLSRLHCLQSYWRSFSLFMSSPWNKLSIKTLKHYILNKNATLTPNSCDFYDLRTFVGKFCRRDLRTFSAEFWRLKRRNPQTESLLECMVLRALAKTWLIKCSNSNTQIQKSETFLCSLWSLFLSWVVSDTSDTRAQKIIEPLPKEEKVFLRVFLSGWQGHMKQTCKMQKKSWIQT